MSELLGYFPPKSAGFGHAARVRDPAAAWAMTQAFLSTHCIATLREDVLFRLWGPDLRTDDPPDASLIDAARTRLGPEDPEWSSPSSPGWPLTAQRLPDALALYFDHRRKPKQDMGPVEFDLCYDFEWRAFEGAWPKRNRLGVRFGTGRTPVFLQPDFYFPFAFDSREHAPWLDRIVEDAPFEFRDPLFKRLLVSKNGEKFSGWRKLSKGWRDALT